ncbi:MAG TPA: EamA family transporter [Anaerolineales bacterium]|nr:EamA family transporter [Anaerolineales bacterium]
MKARIWLAMLAVYIAWGSTYLAIRVAIETMPPFLMAGTRFVIAGLILYAWRLAAGDARPSRLEWRSAAIVGTLLLVGGNGGVVWAEQWVSSGIAALIVGSAPLMMALIDALRPGGRKPGWLASLGLMVGFGGIVLLVGLVGGEGDPLEPNAAGAGAGVAALLLASFLWAAGSLYNREAQLPESPLLGTGMEMLVGSAGLFLLGTVTGEWSRLELGAISLRSLAGLAYLVVGGALIGFVAYTWLLRVAPTPLVATYAYVNPLIAILIGNLLLQEPLTPRVLISALLILSAVALTNMERSQAPKKPLMAPAPGND